jgi:hypothetical protein
LRFRSTQLIIALLSDLLVVASQWNAMQSEYTSLLGSIYSGYLYFFRSSNKNIMDGFQKVDGKRRKRKYQPLSENLALKKIDLKYSFLFPLPLVSQVVCLGLGSLETITSRYQLAFLLQKKCGSMNF